MFILLIKSLKLIMSFTGNRISKWNLPIDDPETFEEILIWLGGAGIAVAGHPTRVSLDLGATLDDSAEIYIVCGQAWRGGVLAAVEGMAGVQLFTR